MFPSNAHAIRIETDPDAPVLRDLAALDEDRPLATPALIGHVGGRPAAALSLVDDRIVADPFVHTEAVRIVLRLRATGIRAVERRPSLRERLLAGLGARFRRTASAGAS
jgi:hypothetical protein